MKSLRRMGQRVLNRHLAKRTLEVRADAPIVSFTFDDIPRTAATVGAPILEDAGVVGTFYLAMGLMDQPGDLGHHASLTEVRALQSAGHELACHTHDHLLSVETSASDYLANCQANCQALESAIPGLSITNFSYPAGSVRAAHKRALGQRFDSMRGVEPGPLSGPLDRNLLPGHKLYSNHQTTARLADLIHRNARERGWLILYTHDVGDAPSPYGCTPRLLSDTLHAAIDSGARILSVAAALSALERCAVER